MSENSEDVTYMPTGQFDELARTLDEPDDASRLVLSIYNRRRRNRMDHVDPRLLLLLNRAGEEWGALGVAKAAAHLAGHHVEPGEHSLLEHEEIVPAPIVKPGLA